MADSARRSLRDHLDARADPQWVATVIASLSDVGRLVLRWCAFMPLEDVLNLDGWSILYAEDFGTDQVLMTSAWFDIDAEKAEAKQQAGPRVLGYVPRALIRETKAYVKRVFPDEIDNVFRFPFGTVPPPLPTTGGKQLTLDDFLWEMQVAIRKQT